MIEFCKDYLDTAGTVADLGKYFLIAALVVGMLYALVEVWKRFMAPVPKADGPPLLSTVTGQEIKALADALRELVAALAAAPVWLALIAVGLMTFWVAGNSLPSQCTSSTVKPPALVKKDAPAAGQTAAGATIPPSPAVSPPIAPSPARQTN